MEHIPESIAAVAVEERLGVPLAVHPLGVSDGNLFKKATVYYVFGQGMVLASDKGEATDSFRWDQVEEFTTNVHRPETDGAEERFTPVYEFGLAGDRTVRLAGMSPRSQTPGHEDFAALVEPMLTEVQLPRALDALARGETVDFNLFKIEPEGIFQYALRPGRRRLPWSQLRDVAVERGSVKVYATDLRRAWAVIDIASVSNLEVFLRIVRSHLPQQA